MSVLSNICGATVVRVSANTSNDDSATVRIEFDNRQELELLIMPGGMWMVAEPNPLQAFVDAQRFELDVLRNSRAAIGADVRALIEKLEALAL